MNLRNGFYDVYFMSSIFFLAPICLWKKKEKFRGTFTQLCFSNNFAVLSIVSGEASDEEKDYTSQW